jgi:hypothetical protein
VQDRELSTAPQSARASSPAPPAACDHALLELQGRIGNRAVSRMLARGVSAERLGARPSSVRLLLRDDTVAAAAPASAPTQIVFIMGHDKDGFYSVAERFWRARAPGATIVNTARSLVDIINYLNANVPGPVRELDIVSHANEDGTLSFGVDSHDQNHKMPFIELKEALHPPNGSPSRIPALQHGQVDGHTMIEIKGCNIGRSTDMLDLLDEAFGGAGLVQAPTHEQGYGYDFQIADMARQQIESLIRSDAERHHPAPPPVDPLLSGPDRAAAQSERARLLQERARAIQAEISSRRGEVTREVEWQGVNESLSGPELSHPGIDPLDHDFIVAEVDRLYGHLSSGQRARLVAELERAQRTETVRPISYILATPTTVAHATRFWREPLAENGFTVQHLLAVDRAVSGGDVVVNAEVSGQFRGPPTRPGTLTLTSSTPTDERIIEDGRGRVANPEHFTWDLEETPAPNGTVERAARGRRRRAYLHHRSLDAGPMDHFWIEPGTPEFFGSSDMPRPAPAAFAP